MPSSRQFRVIGFVTILAILIVYYVSNGAQSTQNSPFYKSTTAAIQDRKDAEARKVVAEAEQSRQERVNALRKEHEIAMAIAAEAATTSASAGTAPLKQQQPIMPKPQQPAQQQPPQQQQQQYGNEEDDATATEKSVAGRKKMKDDKIVHGRPGNDGADGVAKVGNVSPKATENTRKPPTEQSKKENPQVEAELDSILKRGPIIVFSKSYCPYSKKAKTILLDLYKINPRPFVVELDEHALGPELQDALQRLTGRHTVPNVLVNGRSIGGGDDVEALHRAGKLVETVQAMGGKRIFSVQTAEEAERAEKVAVKFKS